MLNFSTLHSRLPFRSMIIAAIFAALFALQFQPLTVAQKRDSRAGAKAKIEELIKASGAETVAVAYYDLATGEELLLNGDESFHAASTMKVPVMMELFRQAEAK